MEHLPTVSSSLLSFGQSWSLSGTLTTLQSPPLPDDCPLQSSASYNLVFAFAGRDKMSRSQMNAPVALCSRTGVLQPEGHRRLLAPWLVEHTLEQFSLQLPSMTLAGRGMCPKKYKKGNKQM
eukprot:536645-Amphidinium_carterae.1